jgi:hypothetical protein
MQGPGARLRWRLDGAVLGSAADPVVWAPVPGRHTLSLVDEADRTLAAVVFDARGPAHTSSE